MGSIVAADRPQPVAWPVRDAGANRQNVRRIADDLARERLVAFEANPHRRRAQPVVRTQKGRRDVDEAVAFHDARVGELAEGIAASDLAGGGARRPDAEGAARGGHGELNAAAASGL